jgi:iron complex outermembrane receptor protein
MKNGMLICLCMIGQISWTQNYPITGSILDQNTGESIEYATVTLYAAADSSLIDGTVTDESGSFYFKQVKDIPIYLVADFLGYQSFSSRIFKPSSQVVFNNIQLVLKSADLDEILVVSKNITSLHKLEKQIYDAAQFENAKGGTAADVLKNLPSININSFGEISIRGTTGFLIMINGKPIQGDPLLILQQLPANSIEDIEVVTAPSAKYDPDGNAGIINIKTRQAKMDGLFLVANLLTGLPSIESYNNQDNTQRYGADVTLNYKKGKWDFSTGLDFRRYDISGRRVGYVNTYLNEILTEFPSEGERSFDELNYAARASIDYTLNNNQTITAGVYIGKRTKNRTADILYENQQKTVVPKNEYLGTRIYYNSFLKTGKLNNNGTLLNRVTFYNENLRVRRSDFSIASLEYKLILDDLSTLKISGLYERNNLGGPTDNSNLDYPNTNNILQLQFNDNTNPLDGFRFQLDYARTLYQQNWESGYQYRYLKHPGDFQYFDRDLVNNIWIENPLFTNRINLTRSIHSLYSQISGGYDKLEYTAGLRLEYFDRTVEIARPEDIFNLNRWNLFPSLNISYALKEGLLAKAGYSRRIERTTTFKMTPFPEREHSETLEQGDAELLPEYIDLIEIGLVKNWLDHSIFMTAYYRRIKNVINRVNTVFNDTILNRIYTNVGVAQALGLETGTTFYPHKKWKVYFGGNVFNYRINGVLFGEKVANRNTTYSLNTNVSYNFSDVFSAQLAFNYLSERITAQGEDSDFYNPSLSIQRSFFGEKLTVGLQWQNIDLGFWNANEQRITTFQNDFFTTTNYIYEVDIIQLNFTYRLNQIAKNIRLPKSEFGSKEF